ncbi:hypothetical protein AtNW77_Chr5g0110091 [Arabidopsis thaliana]
MMPGEESFEVYTGAPIDMHEPETSKPYLIFSSDNLEAMISSVLSNGDNNKDP